MKYYRLLDPLIADHWTGAIIQPLTIQGRNGQTYQWIDQQTNTARRSHMSSTNNLEILPHTEKGRFKIEKRLCVDQVQSNRQT